MIIKYLGEQAYQDTWGHMLKFTQERDENTEDELWLLQHPPVFTLGQAGKKEHILNPHNIPVINTDRGGQVTYHGPGQIVAYILCDLKRRNIGIRNFVCLLEKIIIETLATYQITANGNRNMPGVYVNNKKIASIGLRVKRGCSYHGICFNIDMDMTPFKYINPCGYENLEMTQLIDLVTLTNPNNSKNNNIKIETVMERLSQAFSRHLLAG